MKRTDNDGKKSPMEGAEEARSSPGGKVRRQGVRKGKRASKAVDQKTKLERSRQSARECRARKKEKYQLLEEMVEQKEKEVVSLRSQLESFKKDLANGILPSVEDQPTTDGSSGVSKNR
ncbi:cAMP-responsive element-binding protein-like 2 [Holothuria leucospilota]|uniref:cAMP-responsive element-binding protein-like 2 n=1 Tax=Holothuria leucospilota TaxID=206669 RepID=A0A9Q1BBR3_HOLLE|nr:cAMP-responsive element-binding protein-like 2 [Holothuria leucospilota]